jgi:hypothetical protein
MISAAVNPPSVVASVTVPVPCVAAPVAVPVVFDAPVPVVNPRPCRFNRTASVNAAGVSPVNVG